MDEFEKTCTADTLLQFAVDGDDPQRDEYRELTTLGAGYNVGPSSSMVEALNRAATQDVVSYRPFAIGFMGDDHRPRTIGWDAAYLAALRKLGTGIAYGDDLLQGRNLATQCAMTSDIVRELGYMVPPALTHLYVDNFWMTLGAGAGCLKYLPQVVVEHRHPAAGKAIWDENYARVNNSAMYERDAAAFAAYCADELAGDVEKVKALRAVHV